jgi:flagellar motor switch protein FliM
MSKILSQEEIDALLASVVRPGSEQRSFVPESATAAVRAMPYDFKHPNRVSKDQLRKFENIHDTFAGKLSSALSNIQRAMVDVELVSVDQVTYTEFINSLKAPSCTYTFELAPLKGLCIIDIKSSLTFAIVDRLFGGRGSALTSERELTGIERNVMRSIMGRVFEELEHGWERVQEVKARPAGFPKPVESLVSRIPTLRSRAFWTNWPLRIGTSPHDTATTLATQEK